jgi:membrane associated rhomboid family serine protease
MPYRTSGMTNPFGFALTLWVKRLLMINGAVFLFTLAFAGVVPYLAFLPADVLSRPWTPVSYMFVHATFFHLLFNMLGLFFFGPPLEERWGAGAFAKFYLICGLGGALLSLAFPYQPIVGASAAVYGIMVAYAMYWPDNPIYIWGIFPVKAKWLVMFLVGISLFYAAFGGASNVAHLAHLGGCAAAFLYLKSGWGPLPFGSVYTPSLSKTAAPGPSWRDKLRPAPSAPPKQRPSRSEDDVLTDVDRILDKISEHGLASLTPEERQRLDEVSRKYRTN